MDYRRLAGTDLDVSVLSYGPTRIAGEKPGDDPRAREGARAFSAALDAGINLIHSSYEYREGARAVIGAILKDHPKRAEMHHVVKVPAPDFDDDEQFAEAKFRLRIEEALRDFHADRVAVVQWMLRSKPNDDAHRQPLLARIIDDVAATFGKMRDEGKVGYLLTFPYSVATGRAAVETGAFSGLLGYHNPLDMDLAELFPELERRNMGFIAIRPYQVGLLTDRRSSLAALPPDDRLQDDDPVELFRRRDLVVAAFREEIGDSMTRFALRFPLLSRVTASVVVGLNTAEQVHAAVAASEGVTPRPDLVARAHALWEAEFATPDRAGADADAARRRQGGTAR